MVAKRIKHPKKRAFLAAYAECGNVTQAAEIAGIDRNTHYGWKHSDPLYAEALAAAEGQAADRLEQEARRRAVEGVIEPVFYKGKMVTEGEGESKKPVGIRRFSDTLLIFLMKGAMPEKYKERVAAEHTGKNGGPIEVTKYDQLSDAEIDKLIADKLIAYAKVGATDPD